ncbi:MAG: VanZ family protein [Gammaproteobacteria bacterium]
MYFRWALLGAVLLINYFAFAPLEGSVVQDINDKLQHFTAFYALALLLDFAFPHSPYRWRKLLLLVSYGLLIETVQYFLPWRSFSLFDWLVDIVALLTYGFSQPVLKKIPLLRLRWQNAPLGKRANEGWTL